jgi:hypothetical protein
LSSVEKIKNLTFFVIFVLFFVKVWWYNGCNNEYPQSFRVFWRVKRNDRQFFYVPHKGSTKTAWRLEKKKQVLIEKVSPFHANSNFYTIFFSLIRHLVSNLLHLKCGSMNRLISWIFRFFLIRNGIHPNPGPNPSSVKPNKFAITTFNVRGTAQRGKLRTVLSTFRPLVKKGHIVCLQETHFIDNNYFDKVWQLGKIVANGTGRSCGVIMLYNNELWDCINEECDLDGRYTVATLQDKKSDRKLLITNIYAPNNFNDSIAFFNNVFDCMERVMGLLANNESNDLDVCLLGDFNFVVDETQCYRRAHKKA